jgi:hypothetical protein
MARYHVFKADLETQGFVIDTVGNGDVARGIAAERYKEKPEELQALLMDDESRPDVYLADELHKVAMLFLQAYHRKKTRRVRAVYDVLCACYYSQAQEAHNLDAERHIAAVEAFERRVTHPRMLVMH